MRPVMSLCVLAVTSALLGCTQTRPPTINAVLCSSTPVNGPVYIEIDSAAKANPEVCVVKKVTLITWIGPTSEARPFTIDFKGEVVAYGETLPTLRRSEIDQTSRRHKTQVLVRNVTGPMTYKYDISGYSATNDPIIIIKPSAQ